MVLHLRRQAYGTQVREAAYRTLTASYNRSSTSRGRV